MQTLLLRGPDWIKNGGYHGYTLLNNIEIIFILDFRGLYTRSQAILQLSYV